MTPYQKYIQEKTQLGQNEGFKPIWMPDCLFDFQKALAEWAIWKGRSATMAECGLGKTLLQLVLAENVVRKTNKPFLILAPLGVAKQTVSEGEKFGIEAEVSRDGKFTKKIVVTNYERLHYFDWKKFQGCACDESGILKNFQGEVKQDITDFMRKLKYRALYSATPAPNDYIELGTSSEALGYLGYIDMLKMFFKADNDSYAQGGGSGTAKRFNKNHFGGKFRFRGHAEHEFWRWVCSWGRAIRKPSDLGFKDDKFILPELETRQHVIKAKRPLNGMLFTLPAHGLSEQRQERRQTIEERCEKAAALCEGWDSTISWCHLNSEGDLLEKLIKDCVQVSGQDSIEHKEESFEAFKNGQIKNLVTKTDIAGFGLNFQNCNHQTYFPSHSFEQWYQGIRRSWRFGQTRKVTIDVVTSEGEADVLKNLQRKAHNAEIMFEQLVQLMNNELKIQNKNQANQKVKLPKWG